MGEVLERGLDVVAREIGLTAQEVELGVADVEGDGARQILDRILAAADVELGFGAG